MSSWRLFRSSTVKAKAVEAESSQRPHFCAMRCFCCGTLVTYPEDSPKFRCSVCDTTMVMGEDQSKEGEAISYDVVRNMVEVCLRRENEEKGQKEKGRVEGKNGVGGTNGEGKNGEGTNGGTNGEGTNGVGTNVDFGTWDFGGDKKNGKASVASDCGSNEASKGNAGHGTESPIKKDARDGKDAKDDKDSKDANDANDANDAKGTEDKSGTEVNASTEDRVEVHKDTEIDKCFVPSPQSIFFPLSSLLYRSFRSYSALNRSFSVHPHSKAHYHTSNTDYAAVRATFMLLSRLPTRRPLYSALRGALHLARRVHVSRVSDDPRSLVWLLILLEVPFLGRSEAGKPAAGMGDDPAIRDMCSELLARCTALLVHMVTPRSADYVASWFAAMSETAFIHKVDMMNLQITHRLRGCVQTEDEKEEPMARVRPVQYANDWRMRASAAFLAVLWRANGVRRKKVPPGVFYNSMVDYVDVRGDFIRWEKATATCGSGTSTSTSTGAGAGMSTGIGNGNGTSTGAGAGMPTGIGTGNGNGTSTGNGTATATATATSTSGVSPGSFSGIGPGPVCSPLLFCSYPFLLSLGCKIRILEYEARRQMERKAEEAFVTSLDRRVALDVYFRVRVRRTHIVEDSLRAVRAASPDVLKKSLRVQFEGEPGIDAGGLKKEWFLLVTKEMGGLWEGDVMWPKASIASDASNASNMASRASQSSSVTIIASEPSNASIMASTNKSNRASIIGSEASKGNKSSKSSKSNASKPTPSESSSFGNPIARFARARTRKGAVANESNDTFFSSGFGDSVYYLFGSLLGLAIYNSTVLDLQFPLAMYKILTHHSVGIDDYAELFPEAHASLMKLYGLSNTELASLELTFEATHRDANGVLQTVELVPRGSQTAVCLANLDHYIESYWRFFLVDRVRPHLDAMVSGFTRVAGGNALSLFSPPELRLLVCGTDEGAVDMGVLRSVTTYAGFAASDPVVAWFWAVAQSLPQSQRRKLLRFVTGSDRLPATGIHNLKFRVVMLGGDSERLPVAHTCFNELGLWGYESREKLEGKLMMAVNESEGFGIR